MVRLVSVMGNSGLDHFEIGHNEENVEKLTGKKSCGTEMKH